MTPAGKPPFWISPPSTVLRDGAPYCYKWTIAKTRADRKKNGIEIEILHAAMAPMSVQERQRHVSKAIMDAAIKIGALKNALIDAKKAELKASVQP